MDLPQLYLLGYPLSEVLDFWHEHGRMIGNGWSEKNRQVCLYSARNFVWYGARLKGGPQVVWMLQAKPSRSGNQEQQQSSTNPGTAFQPSPVLNQPDANGPLYSGLALWWSDIALRLTGKVEFLWYLLVNVQNQWDIRGAQRGPKSMTFLD